MRHYHNSHRKLNVWKEAILLAKVIYHIQHTFPKHETYGLCDQLRRAVVSISANIAEGNARQTINDRKRFFLIALSSLAEIDSLLAVSVEIGYINSNQLIDVERQCELVSKMLSGMIE